MDAKEFDYHNYLDLLEEKEDKKFLAYLSREDIGTVEDFVQFLNADNFAWFNKLNNPKVILATNKNKTPVLWKVLSKEFKNYLHFGIIKQSSGELLKSLNLEKFPMILGYNKSVA